MLSRLFGQKSSLTRFSTSLKSSFISTSKPFSLGCRRFSDDTLRFEKSFEELNLGVDFVSCVKPELKYLEKLGKILKIRKNTLKNSEK